MTARNSAGPHRPGPTGDPIRSDELRPIREALELLGWGAKSLAAAKKRGLRVLSFAGRSYIYGGDLIEFLRQQPAADRPAAGGRPDLVARRNATQPDSLSGDHTAETSGNGARRHFHEVTEPLYQARETLLCNADEWPDGDGREDRQ